MKPALLVTSGMILGIAIGFMVKPDAKPREQASTTPRGTAAEQPPPRTNAGERHGDSMAQAGLAAFLNGRDISALTAEEAFQLMQPGQNPDFGKDALETTRFYYQCQLLVSKLPLPVLEQLLTLSQQNGVPEERLQQMIASYAARDWTAATAWVDKQPDGPDLWFAAINELAGTDPERAMELYDKKLKERGSHMPPFLPSLNMAGVLARKGNAEFFRFLDQQPSGFTSSLIHSAMRNIPKEQIPAFLDELQKRSTDGRLARFSMDFMMDSLAESHPEEALRRAGLMESASTRSAAQMNVVTALAKQGKTAEAEKLMESTIAGYPGDKNDFIRKQAIGWVSNNPKLAARLAAMLPEEEGLTPEQVSTAGIFSATNPSAMVDMVALFREPEDKVYYLEDSLKRLSASTLNAKDFEILSGRLDSLGLTGEYAERTRTAFEKAKEKALAKKPVAGGGE